MVAIDQDLVQILNAHGEKTYPEECCGMLLGNFVDGDYVVREAIEISNEQEANRERRFLISPECYIQAEKMAQARNMDLLGFYHSHPDHPAAPSAFDTEHALPWFTYLIVSVVGGRAGNLTAWVLTEGREGFREHAIAVEECSEQIQKHQS